MWEWDDARPSDDIFVVALGEARDKVVGKAGELGLGEEQLAVVLSDVLAKVDLQLLTNKGA